MNDQSIVSLEINNVMRVSALKIYPDGQLVVIGGANGQGKSSVLRTIWMVLGGADFVPDEPIKRGASEGNATLELTDIIVHRRFSTKTGTTLKVTTKDGSPISSPQKLLDSLINGLSFDPTEFTSLCESNKEEAAKIVRKLAGLDTSALDADYKAVFESRTVTNRNVGSAKGKLAAYPAELFQGVPNEEISAAKIMEELAKVQVSNRGLREQQSALAELKSKRSNIANTIDAGKALIEQKKSELATGEKALLSLLTSLKVTDEAIAWTSIPAEQDETVFTTQIADAETVNQKVRQKARRNDLVKELDSLTLEASKQTKRLEEIEAEKARLLQAAKFPIPEISVNDSGVLLNGFPFTQASSAEQLRAGLAMAMAMHPQLRVICCRAGNDLDENSLKLVAQMAEEKKYQVILERVGEGKEVSFIIEDGHLKGGE